MGRLPVEVSEGEEMSGLKTLKDFMPYKPKETESFMDLVDGKKLKQEAIKWVNDKEEYEHFDHNRSFWRWVFMNFFNIKEEDLK